MIPQIELPSGEPVPVLGQGSRGLGEGRRPAAEEIAALRLGLDLELSLIDTAGSYGDGAAETLVGRAIAGRRDGVFLLGRVDAAWDLTAACEGSLGRLGTDRLDLLALDGRGSRPLEESVAALERLRERGLIRHWGVAGFSVADLAELAGVDGADAVQAVQVVYGLAHREIEWDLLPACFQSGLPLLAGSPLDGGRVVGDQVLRGIGVRHHASSAQVALAWVVSHAGVHAHVRATTPAHVHRNRAALDLALDPDDLVELDAAFEPPPRVGGAPLPGGPGGRL
jgi:diketogulonate reductase-like aldo/keto reductase